MRAIEWINDVEVLKIGNQKVKRGERKRVYLESAALYDSTQLSIPVEVIRGKERGPILFISAAIHGDEINGVEIIRRLLKKSLIKRIHGTLILIPIVNVFGFNYKSRYLPDRRDLNRSFPGRKNGSLASRMAYIFMKEVVSKCTHGIDLHTASGHRTNLPQVRACLDDKETETLAKNFKVPVLINSKLRDGSLREAARKKNVKMLLYEGGQALRFEEDVINIGLKGCISVMKSIGMIPKTKIPAPKTKVFIAESSSWVRAPISGTSRSKRKIGDKVKQGDLLAIISDPFGEKSEEVRADEEGILVGISLLPLVNKGDALYHIATFSHTPSVKQALSIYDNM